MTLADWISTLSLSTPVTTTSMKSSTASVSPLSSYQSSDDAASTTPPSLESSPKSVSGLLKGATADIAIGASIGVLCFATGAFFLERKLYGKNSLPRIGSHLDVYRESKRLIGRRYQQIRSLPMKCTLVFQFRSWRIFSISRS
jgi:hypothetical protein